MGIETSFFGKTAGGEIARLYRLYNDYMEMTVTDYGACLVNVWFRDKRGRFQDIVWGYDTLAEYEENEPNLGAIIGRNANRIGGAEVTVGGVSYPLELMPWYWQTAHYLFPAGPAVLAFVKLNSMGGTLADVWPQMLTMWIQVLVYGTLALCTTRHLYGEGKVKA